MFRAFLFDLDGVIIDSRPVMKVAYELSAEQRAPAHRARYDEFLSHSGAGLREIVDIMGLPADFYDHYRRYSRQHSHLVRLCPGMRGFLTYLRERHLPCGLITGKEEDRTKEILSDLQIEEHFDSVVCGDQVRFSKPHPQGVEITLTRLIADPADAVVVGDAPNDVVAARRASVAAIGVSWGVAPPQRLIAAGAMRVVEHAEELRAFAA